MIEKEKKVPLRKCVVTGMQHPKQEMFRIVRTKEGDVVICDTGKTRGRGVYLTKDLNVVKKAKAKHLLDKHLEITVDDSIYDELLRRLENE